MTAVALALALATPQDPLETRLAELLREEDTEELLDALESLGAAALPLIARALADDLRDGMAAAAAPVLVDVLMGHRDTLEPLRAAFRDPRTPPDGRLEVAKALEELGDDSWRDEVRRMSKDPALDERLRRKASALLELATLVDEPRETLVPEAGLQRTPAPPQKTLGRTRPEGTMSSAALLFGGSSLALLGLLLWTLRRKD